MELLLVEHRPIDRVPMKLTHLSTVTRGLNPRVHPLRKKMDCRVKPGNDAVGESVCGTRSSTVAKPERHP